MKDIAKFPAVLLFFVLPTWGVQAQIYETADEEGNPVFSDTPSPDAKEVVLPVGNIADAPPPTTSPAEATPEPRPQQDAKQRNAWKDQIDEEVGGTTEQREPIASTSTPVGGLSGQILAEDQLVCGGQLSKFVPGESESERLYERPEPTELDSVQSKLLKQLFSAMGQNWRGEKVFYKCMDAEPGSEIKTYHREAISDGNWNIRDSELTFKTGAVLNHKTTGTLFEFYGVGHGLYFSLKSFGAGSGFVAGIPPNLKKPGNMVQIVSLETDRLGFLIKKRNVEGVLSPQLVYLERSGNGLTIIRASFVNAALTDWVITKLFR